MKIFFKVNKVRKEKTKKKKNQLEKKQFEINIKENFFRYILILIFIYQLSIESILCKGLFLNANEITLRVKGIGSHDILYQNYIDIYYPCPDKIYINNQEVNLNPCYRININKTSSIIKLVWNESLNTTRYLFRNCVNITEISLKNFDTSNVRDMGGMFQGCAFLQKIGLFNLNTKNVKILSNMFYDCISLTSVDLSNFDTSSVVDMNYLFYNCEKLEYINLTNFCDKENQTILNIFSGVAKNAVICLDPSKANKIYNAANNNIFCVTISCEENWRIIQQKINFDTKECVNNCNLTTNNKLEHRGVCFKFCPENTTLYMGKCYSSEELCDNNCKTCYSELEGELSSNCSSCYENKFLNKGKCVDNCENGFYLDVFDSTIKKCKCSLINCTICTQESLFNNNSCISCNEEEGYFSIYKEIKDNNNFIQCYKGNISGYYFDNNDKYYKECYKTCKTCNKKGNDTNNNCLSCKSGTPFRTSGSLECFQFLDTIINNIDIGNNSIIPEKNISFIITVTNIDKNITTYNNNVIIDLGDCENKLKEKYNISHDKTLYIAKIVDPKNKKKVEFEVYYDFNGSLEKLNLSVCRNVNIIIPISIDFDIDIESYNYDFSIEYYRHLCSLSCESNNITNVSLEDRSKDFIIPNLNDTSNFSKQDLIIPSSNISFNISKLKLKDPFINNETIDNDKTSCEDIGEYVNNDKENDLTCYCNYNIEEGKTKLIDIEVFFENMKSFEKISNIKILKCFNLIFNTVSFKSNCANFIILPVIIYYFINLIIFYQKDYSYLKQVLNVIEYSISNPNEVREILQKGNTRKPERQKIKKNQEKENKSEILGIKENNSNPLKKKGINIINTSSSVIENNKNNNNNIRKKKKKKKKKNIIKNNNLINRLPTDGIIENILDKNKIKNLFGDLSEEQLIEMLNKIYNYSDIELNDFDYKKAKLKDERAHLQYYRSLVLINHLFFYSFWPSFDYNSRLIKIYLFFFNLMLKLFINALFYDKGKINKTNNETGENELEYNIAQTIYSSLISGVVNGLIKKLVLTGSIILELKLESNKKDVKENINKTWKIMRIKFIFFFVINLIILIFIWLYTASFCAVYKRLQFDLLKDTFISFGISMTYPLAFYFIPGFFRIKALRAKTDKECMFKFSKLIQFAVSLL